MTLLISMNLPRTQSSHMYFAFQCFSCFSYSDSFRSFPVAWFDFIAMRSYLFISSLFLLFSGVISDIGLSLDIFNEGFVNEGDNLYSLLQTEPSADNDIFSKDMGEELNGNVPSSFASNDYCSSSPLSSSSVFDDSLFESVTRKLRIRRQDRCSVLRAQKKPPIKLELPRLKLPSEPEPELQNPLLRGFPKSPFYKEPECAYDQKSYCCPYGQDPDGKRRGCVSCERTILFPSFFFTVKSLEDRANQKDLSV